MDRLHEKAEFEYKCQTIDELIEVLEDIQDVMGNNVKVGRINSIHPSINVQLYNYNNAVVVLN